MAPLKPHDLAVLMPGYADARAYEALRASMKDLGQLDVITLYQGKILDGCHRHKLCGELGIKPRLVEFKGTPQEALAFVIGKAQGRQMDDSQKAAAAALVAMKYMEAGRARKALNLKRGVENPKVDDAENPGKSTKRAADEFGVSETYVKAAVQIYRAHQPTFWRVHGRGVTRMRTRLNISQARNLVAKRVRLREVRSAGRRVQLAQGDCRLFGGDNVAAMNRLDAGCARVVFADPPYNNGWSYDADKTGDDLPPEKYLDLTERWMRAAARLLAPDGSMFVLIDDAWMHDYEAILRRIGLFRRNLIVWWEHFPNNQRGNFSKAARFIFYYTKSAVGYVFNAADPDVRVESKRQRGEDARANPNGKLPDNVWPIDRSVGNSKARIPFGPTPDGFDPPPQIPDVIPARCVLIASNPGDLVVDPFCGNGTTGRAAVVNGRRFVGMERSDAYRANAEQWIKAAVAAQPKGTR